MQKLNSLDQWKPVQPGEIFTLPLDKKRKVRLLVNAPEPTAIWDITGEGKRFLARVEGLDVIEFTTDKALELSVDGLVNIFTSDGQQVHIADTGSKSFTKIVKRRPRNVEQEQMLYRAQLNQVRMMQQLFGDQNEELAALREELEDAKSRIDDKPEGNTGVVEEQPESSGGEKSPAEKGDTPTESVQPKGGEGE